MATRLLSTPALDPYAPLTTGSAIAEYNDGYKFYSDPKEIWQNPKCYVEIVDNVSHITYFGKIPSFPETVFLAPFIHQSGRTFCPVYFQSKESIMVDKMQLSTVHGLAFCLPIPRAVVDSTSKDSDGVADWALTAKSDQSTAANHNNDFMYLRTCEPKSDVSVKK